MTTPQLLCSAALSCAIAGAPACTRTETDANARRAAKEVREVAARAGDQLADSWITTKIQAQYFADNDIKARYINVSTRDGHVTLTGRVETPGAREQAVQIAKSTDGVAHVQDQLTVGSLDDASSAPEQMDAAWITTKIQAKYFTEPHVNGRDIDVSTVNGVVTLRGQVETEPQKQLALSIARSTDGVTRVDDRLVVRPPAAVATTGADLRMTQPDDGRITSTIQSKYFLDDLVKGRRLNVDTRQGVVTLRGELGSETERAQALLLARTTEGVQRVEDHLAVNAAAAMTTDRTAAGAAPSASTAAAGRFPSDEMLTTRIQSKFFLDSQVRTSTIEVTSKDGVVLQGTVPNGAVRRRVLTIARNTEGVVQVVDRLKVASRRTG